MSVFSRFLQLQGGAARTVDLSANTLAAGGLQLNGSSTGNLSQYAAASTTNYSVIWPATQGAPSSFLQNDGSGNLSWGSVASSPSISSNFTAGENFAANKSFVVRWAMDSLSEDTSEIFKADYDSTTEDDFWVIGIAHSPTFRSAGQAITVYSFGAYTLGSGDTQFDSSDIGKPVWLTGVGTFSTIAPTGDAQADFKVGIVIGVDKIWLDGQMMGIGNTSGGGVPVNPLAIEEGGTGKRTKSEAFDALSPMSAAGDLIVGGASGTGTNLGVGTEGQILSVVSGTLSWIDFSPTSSLAQNHIFVGNASGIATDVAMSGEASIVASGAVTLSNAAIIAKVLTGFSSGAGSISSSDSILSAIQKLDGNIAGKQASGNYITALTGEVSASGPGSSSATISNAAVIAKLLTGYSAAAGTVSSSDSILGAIQKLDGNAATLNTKVNHLVTLSGVSSGSDDLGTFTGSIIPDSSTVKSALQSLETSIEGITDAVTSVNGDVGVVTVNAINQLTGDVTASAASGSQSKATSVDKIQGTAVSGTTGSGNVVFSASPTLTGTLVAAAANFSGLISASNFSGSSSGSNTGDQTITLTGEATGSGTGSFAVTLTNAAVIGKVLTGYTSGAGTVAATDTILQAIQKLNGNIIAASGSAITSLTGDATASGPGSAALTLATVNSNVGSFGSSTSIPSFTVNAKGLITAASGNSVIAPAGTLTGTTLNATVVTSSLTSVGTITSGIWTGTTIAIANGGTGQTSKAAAFDALSPMSALGDIIYGGASGTGTRLAGNTTTTKKFLTQTGDGTNSAAAVWNTIVAGDVPTLNQNTTGTASNLSGTPALPNGTTATTQSQADNSTKLATTAYVDSGLSGKISTGFYRAGQQSILQTYTFTVTSANATVGATYTNNAQTFTVINTIAGSTTLVCNGTGAPAASGTLTKATGTGDATITFSTSTNALPTSQVINFSSTLGNTNYGVNVVMKNTTDASPQFQPLVITQKFASGIVVTWNALADSLNYSLEYTAFPNV